jgi:AhpD family alkylhydroperoxidase
MNYMHTAPSASRAMSALETWVRTSSGIDPVLLALVRLRASQINGCPYCIDVHWKDARALGEPEQRIYLLAAWRESPFYTDRERAALLWTEHITLIHEDHVPDRVYEVVRESFSEEELVHLTVALVAINSWNRLGIAFRTPPGDSHPAEAKP